MDDARAHFPGPGQEPAALTRQAPNVEKAAAMVRTAGTVRERLESRGDLEARDLSGQTALIWAAQHGESELVKDLLKAGAEINAKDWWGRTALVVAIHKGHRNIVEMLMAHQADIGA